MATRIEDLPGPSEIMDLGTQMPQIPQMMATQMPMPPTQMPMLATQMPMQMQTQVPYNENQKNTKEQTEKMSMLGYLKGEIKEENVLLLVILFISTMRNYDIYLYKVLPLSFRESNLVFNILKAVLLFVIYKLVQLYIIPKIRI